MTLIHHGNRTRATAATKRRDQNVRRFIAALRNGPMLRDDIRAMLFLSASGINKYIRLLREEGVVELDRYIAPTRLSLGHPLYRLASDTEQVERYLRSLDGPREVRTKPAPATRPHNPNSRIYRMEDDGKFKCPAPQWPIPAPDPVLAAFFGLG